MFYDKFKSLCDQKGVSCNKAATEIGLSNSTATKWKNTGATPDFETLKKIAKYFDIATSQLTWDDYYPMVKCWECDDYYNSSKPSDVKAHEERHAKWKATVKKFGFCWAVSYREEVKAEARNIINGGDLPADEYVSNQIIVFKALFSRSLSASGFDLRHVDFPKYVAMLLHQDFWKKKIREDVYEELKNQYGTMPGIPRGTYYYVDQTNNLSPKSNKKTASPITDETESEKVKNLIRCFNLLNEEGQEKILDYADDLLKSSKYKKRNEDNVGEKEA